MKILNCMIAILLALADETRGWQQCNADDGGGVCPDFSACCRTKTPGISACVAGRSKYPTFEPRCCVDGVTGCGAGYECAVHGGNDVDDDIPDKFYCKLSESHPPDQGPESPRYRLTSYLKDTTILKTIYGFPMNNEFQAAYYSSQGEIISGEPGQHEAVERVILVVHGSRGHADDYLYAVYSAIPKNVDPATVMIVAPYFVTPEEDDEESDAQNVTSTYDSYRQVLEWYNFSPEVPTFRPTFRWGADAKNAPGISSFDVLDRMVETFQQNSLEYPNLEEIIVTGHSAGGQMTQRWALMSHSRAWKPSSNMDLLSMRSLVQSNVTIGTKYLRQRNTIPIPDLKVVPANPRSFAYLDERRWNTETQTSAIPPKDVISQCPSYNWWIWGLETDHGDEDWISCPYRDRGPSLSPNQVASRYNDRSVVYLQGYLDHLKLTDNHCQETIQGDTRLERGRNFYSYLGEYFGEDLKHEMNEVESPHDHTIIYQSQGGQLALFGTHD